MELRPDMVALPQELAGEKLYCQRFKDGIERPHEREDRPQDEHLHSMSMIQHHGSGDARPRQPSHQLLVAHPILAVPQIRHLPGPIRSVSSHAIELVQGDPLVRAFWRHHDGAFLGIAVQQTVLPIVFLLQTQLPHHRNGLTLDHGLAALETSGVHSVALKRVTEERQFELQRFDLRKHPRALVTCLCGLYLSSAHAKRAAGRARRQGGARDAHGTQKNPAPQHRELAPLAARLRSAGPRSYERRTASKSEALDTFGVRP
mmetsp:Transcript_2005/g.8864  ORF Transcript_2005/g.8864 Transcript_2005/m.8864 type:complete len:260 (-) Transcript_2005:17-796(-)